MGPDQRHLQRRQPRVRHQRRARARTSPARSRTRNGAASWRCSTPSRTTPRTSPSRPAAASRPRASQLDDDSDPALSNTRTFNDLPVGGGYSLGADRPAGRPGRSASATCSDGSPVSNINVAAGEIVTCTFTNQKRGEIVDREGRHSGRSAGLLVHDRRRARAGELPARRRLPTGRCRTRARSRAWPRVAATRSPRRCRAAGTRHRATCNDGSPVSNINVAPGRGRHLHVREPQARPHRGREGRHSGRSTGLLVHGRRRPRPRPASRSTTTPTRRSRTRAPSTTSCRPAATRSPRRVPSGWDQTSATCDDGSPVSNIARGGRGDGHVHLREPQARAARGREGLAAQRRRRTSPSRPAAACRPPASSSTTTPTARCRTHARSRASRPAAATRSRETVPGGWDQTSATCSDGSPTSNVSLAAGEIGHLHLHEPQARADRGGEGCGPERSAGLLVHGRRRPLAVELLSRRRRRRDARRPAAPSPT